MEEEDTKLYIPSNVKVRLEFFKGYGVKELITTIIVAIAMIPIAVLIYYLGEKNYLLPVIIEMVGVVATIVFNTKDENNLCIVSQIKYMINFVGMQKIYDYKYYDKCRE